MILRTVYTHTLGSPSPVIRPNGLCARRWRLETQRLQQCFSTFLGFAQVLAIGEI